jgi:hypothetical protein
MTDYSSFADTPTAPATRAAVVVPHDSNAIADTPKGLYVGGAGDIAMRGATGTTDQLWKAVPAGTVLPFRPSHIRATGTTATAILALY